MTKQMSCQVTSDMAVFKIINNIILINGGWVTKALSRYVAIIHHNFLWLESYGCAHLVGPARASARQPTN